MLESYLRQRRTERDILLMTHIVIGYPSLDESMRVIESMVAAGVDLVEMQIPFSEPIADGPVILHANQMALQAGVTVEQCLRFAEEAANRFDVPLLFMSYYNILFKYGVERFAQKMQASGLRGAIVPDLPPEEAGEYMSVMDAQKLDPIFIFSPTTNRDRLKLIADHARGFVYCVSRKGVTGVETNFSDELSAYLKRCREATDLPLALGFGVKDRNDVQFLQGKVDIAVIGSQTLRLVAKGGAAAVRPFLESLR